MPKRADNRPVWHLFPSCSVEYGTGGPGYRWAPGYAQALPDGKVSIPLRRLDWQAAARQDNARLVFHTAKADAKREAARPVLAAKPGRFVCPEAAEYGCTGRSGRRRLRHTGGRTADEFGRAVRYDTYRCSICGTRFVSTDGGTPELVSA